MKVHMASWEDDPDEEIPMNIELACGRDAYAQDNLEITSNWTKVTCAKCLAKRERAEGRG